MNCNYHTKCYPHTMLTLYPNNYVTTIVVLIIFVINLYCIAKVKTNAKITTKIYSTTNE